MTPEQKARNERRKKLMDDMVASLTEGLKSVNVYDRVACADAILRVLSEMDAK